MTTFLSARYYSVSVQQPPVYNDHVLVVPKVVGIYRYVRINPDLDPNN